ncbi:hypothetical protein P355_4508 [Burkholderia cenocepacia KC-01]|nr:hypothetical protein P355_4508 [Burkholderia cenocepacia KC-01]
MRCGADRDVTRPRMAGRPGYTPTTGRLDDSSFSRTVDKIDTFCRYVRMER